MAKKKFSVEPIIVANEELAFNIPEFEGGLQYYLENDTTTAAWIYDVANFTVHWCNEASLEPCGKTSVEDFIETDKTLDTEASIAFCLGIWTDSLLVKEVFHRWTFKPLNKPSFQAMLRISGVQVNGKLCLLVTMDLSATQSIDTLSSATALAQEAFKFSPTMMSIIHMDGVLEHQNNAAEIYYRNVIKDYQVCRKNKVNVLKMVMENEVLNDMLSRVKEVGSCTGHLKVAPFNPDKPIWHSVSFGRHEHAISGEPMLVVVQMDITMEQRAQRKLEEVEHTKQNQQKDQLVQAVGHELKTPLVGVIGLSDELLKDVNLWNAIKNDENLDHVQKSLAMIKQSSERLLKLVNQMYDFSQYKEQNKVLQYSRFDIVEMIQRVIHETQPTSSRLQVDFEKPEAELPQMIADEVAIHKVLKILISNAVKFTSIGTVLVSLQNRIVQNEGCIVIAVKDSGIGVYECDQERIFQLFEQVDNSDQRINQGAGVGLSLAKKIVEQHGGSIFVASQPNIGSTFTFSLPYRPELL